MPDSRYYTDLTLPASGIVAGRGLMAKFGLHLGDTIELFDKYENATYRLAVEGVWGNDGTMSVYMPLGAANELLGKDADYFSGYLSDMPLALDERYVAGDLTPDQMDKIASQMQDSMGDMMGVFVGVAVAVYVVLMYLLTKTVIEHNARAISYMKVFGYRTREINRLYLRSISQTVVVSLVVAIPVVVALIVLLVKVVFMRYNGNFVVTLPYDRLLLEIALGLACYALVAVVHARRIRRVPLALALKVQE
jgi:putative ABC transport system permease protein